MSEPFQGSQRSNSLSSNIQYDNEWSQRILNIYQTPDIIAQRQQVLDMLKPKKGDNVLDIGSGPGLVAQEIAQIVGPDGSVKCIDNSDAMNVLAKQICAKYPYVEIKKADVTSLPFPDNYFDTAVSTQVYEYVDDIGTSLTELHRVLKPGGRALILDTDWDTLIWHTHDIERMRRILQTFEGHCSHPRLPRTLTSQLLTTGFQVESQSVYVILNTSYNPNTYTYGLIDFIESYVTNSDETSKKEVREWADELRQLGKEGNYFCSNNRYLFLVTKPNEKM